MKTFRNKNIKTCFIEKRLKNIPDVLVRDVRLNIYISRLCYDVSVRLSVRLSVTEVHWHIIANSGFKFRSHFTARCGRAVLLAVPLAGESSRAMLASARYLVTTVTYMQV